MPRAAEDDVDYARRKLGHPPRELCFSPGAALGSSFGGHKPNDYFDAARGGGDAFLSSREREKQFAERAAFLREQRCLDGDRYREVALGLRREVYDVWRKARELTLTDHKLDPRTEEGHSRACSIAEQLWDIHTSGRGDPKIVIVDPDAPPGEARYELHYCNCTDAHHMGCAIDHAVDIGGGGWASEPWYIGYMDVSYDERFGITKEDKAAFTEEDRRTYALESSEYEMRRSEAIALQQRDERAHRDRQHPWRKPLPSASKYSLKIGGSPPVPGAEEG